MVVVDGFTRAIAVVTLIVDANQLALAIIDGFARAIVVVTLVVNAN